MNVYRHVLNLTPGSETLNCGMRKVSRFSTFVCLQRVPLPNRPFTLRCTGVTSFEKSLDSPTGVVRELRYGEALTFEVTEPDANVAAPDVRWEGHLTESDYRSLLAKSSTVLLLSGGEALPISTLEGLGPGAPVTPVSSMRVEELTGNSASPRYSSRRVISPRPSRGHIV